MERARSSSLGAVSLESRSEKNTAFIQPTCSARLPTLKPRFVPQPTDRRLVALQDLSDDRAPHELSQSFDSPTMSSTEAGPSRRRHYTSKACNSCRRRRCKCDGVQPVCGTCSATGHECSWSSEADARRPATKQLVESLRVKIQSLEAEVIRLRGNESVEEAESSLSSRDFVEDLSVRQHQPYTNAGSPPEDESISESTIPVGSANSPSPSAEASGNLPEERSLSTPATQFTATLMYKYIFQIDESIPSNEQSTDIQLSLICEWDRHLPDLDPIQFSRAEHDTILSRCFQYGTSWILGLVPEIFLHDMLYSLSPASADTQPNLPPRLQHYTPMLHCAILAFACGFSDDEVLRSRETRDKFAVHAKQWLDEEVQKPVMCLVRALTLLADYHCGVGQRETGYMYMGMGIRAARAMISSGQQSVWGDQGITSYPESITRDWHFWSTFAQDKLMSLDFGRYSFMPIPRFGVDLPSVDSELDSQPWPATKDITADGKNQPKLTTLVFLESCKLMVIATRIIDATPSLGHDQAGDAVAVNLHLQLDTWFNNLPEQLLVWARSASPLPYVIVLHICYWWLFINLHQPFYHRSHPSNVSVTATNLSVKMCDRGAHKIVQLLKMFDRQYGLRYLPVNILAAISSCGNALLMESASAPPGATKKRSIAHEGVEVCIRALRTVSSTWPCARASADKLKARLDELWPISNENEEMEIDELDESPPSVPASPELQPSPP